MDRVGREPLSGRVSEWEEGDRDRDWSVTDGPNRVTTYDPPSRPPTTVADRPVPSVTNLLVPKRTPVHRRLVHRTGREGNIGGVGYGRPLYERSLPTRVHWSVTRVPWSREGSRHTWTVSRGTEEDHQRTTRLHHRRRHGRHQHPTAVSGWTVDRTVTQGTGSTDRPLP